MLRIGSVNANEQQQRLSCIACWKGCQKNPADIAETHQRINQLRHYINRTVPVETTVQLVKEQISKLEPSLEVSHIDGLYRILYLYQGCLYAQRAKNGVEDPSFERDVNDLERQIAALIENLKSHHLIHTCGLLSFKSNAKYNPEENDKAPSTSLQQIKAIQEEIKNKSVKSKL